MQEVRWSSQGSASTSGTLCRAIPLTISEEGHPILSGLGNSRRSPRPNPSRMRFSSLDEYGLSLRMVSPRIKLNLTFIDFNRRSSITRWTSLAHAQKFDPTFLLVFHS